MGSNLNFKNFGNDPPAYGGGGGRPPGSLPLTRQPSVYSLTFEEFQSTPGGSGKDFGSMNMDELIKNIWSAEENHNLGCSVGGGGGGGQEGSGYLQRQGSLALPRTLSQKTVDEVWRDMMKDANGGIVGLTMPHRQQTLGEITLEEFLVRAGVVREDTQFAAKPNHVGFFGAGFGYQQQGSRNGGLMAGGVPESNNLPLNVNGVRCGSEQLENHQLQQQQQQQILPKQPPLAYGAPKGMAGISDPAINNNMVQNAVLQGGGAGMVGVGVGRGSPAVSSDGLTKSNGDSSSVSPVPYVFNGSLRGRKSAALEKVVERRQRRMIKNRESAARSRARKQAYTMELEAEVAKLKEEHEELQKKQAEMMEVQKNQEYLLLRKYKQKHLTVQLCRQQVLEMMKQQNGAKRQCLRRTQTGPW